MRHEKAEILLRIVLDMQARASGLSLQDIAERYSDEPLSRRTAERLRDVVLRLFPNEVEEIVADRQIKRWKLNSVWTRGMFQMDAATLASLETARKLLARDGLHDQAGKIEQLGGMVRALMKPELQARLEAAVETLSMAEGVALRPGPRVKVNTECMNVVREALQLKRVVRVNYRYRTTNILRHYDLHPYGLLYGHRHYLVGSRTPAGPPRYYILGRIEQAELTRFASIVPDDFSLADYANQSFGVWQEPPVEVHWRFKPEAAEDAADFIFHPTQVTEIAADGSLHVRFRAGGLKEMDWHLYTWGDAVEVISPHELKRPR